MSEREGTQDDGAGTGDPDESGAWMPSVDSDLSDLRAQLDELQQSVERLGPPDHRQWPGDEPPPPHDPRPPPPADEHSPYPDQPYPDQPYPDPPYPDQPYPPSPYGSPAVEPPGLESSPFEARGYEPPPPPPPIGAPSTPSFRGFPPPPGLGRDAPAWDAAPEPEPLTYPAPPAATNGHGTESVDPAEISARSATVAIVEAGPFADLIELRHFEDDLAALQAVRDVRVCRYGQGRAMIEVGMLGPYLLAHELYQLNRPMEVGDGPEGEVVIELAPLPEREVAEFLPRDDGVDENA